MKRFITYGSIEQFKGLYKNFSSYIQYEGTIDGVAQYNDEKLPSIMVSASEKIHGSNASVCFSNTDGFWVQSRKKIITPEKDNHACAFYAMQNEEYWMKIINYLADKNEIDLDKNIISVFYEWCGIGIQANSAVTGLDKRAIVFNHFKVSPIDAPIDNDGNTEASKWIDICFNFDNIPDNVLIYSIMDFPVYQFLIDFNNYEDGLNKIKDVVNNTIEPNSPVGQEFGIKGNIGEGLVCTFKYDDQLFRFKVKGDKHSKTTVKKKNPVDNVRENKKIDFANLVCTPQRLEQAWDECFRVGASDEVRYKTRQETGNFIKLVIADVMKEELDVLAETGLEPKEVNSHVSDIARKWFFNEVDKM